MQFNATLKNFVEHDIKTGLSPMLLGEPGIGKSSFLEAIGDDFHTKVFVIPCNQLADRADLTGARLLPDDKGGFRQEFFPHATIMDCIHYAEENPRETPILFLDEINRASSDITSAILSFTTARRIGTVLFPDNIRFVLAGNDKGNVTALDEASISRFAIYHVEPDVTTFLALDDNLNPFVKKTLQLEPKAIFCKQLPAVVESDDDDDDENTAFDAELDAFLYEDAAFQQIATPRTITYVSNWLNSIDKSDLLMMLQDGSLIEGIQAHTGDTLFSAKLIEVITSDIATVQSTTATVAAVKPNCYDDFKAITDRTALNDYVANMTSNEKSGCLLYALSEAVDNNAYIEALAESVEHLESTDMEMLMKLSMSGGLDKANVNSLIATNSDISGELAVILDLCK